jgi:hypothetical protein
MGIALGMACLMLLGIDCLAFDPGKAGFSVKYRKETSPYRVNAVFLMPGEVLRLSGHGSPSDSFELDDQSQGLSNRLQRTGPQSWDWKSPDSAGLYPLRLYRAGDTVLMNAFVMVPVTEMKGEYLRGYHIGSYPKSPLKGLDFYRFPKGFVEMDDRTAQTRVSPHFRLGQFACKQTAARPAYLALNERLILKLETLLEKANEQGYACETFHVMSGFRTPFYNRVLGNVKFSAHQWGGAADIFIDANPEDGQMDDLNGDGTIDGEDSEVLFKLADAMSLNEFFLPFLGGVGKYNRNESHGPFVHVDVRGFRAVW